MLELPLLNSIPGLSVAVTEVSELLELHESNTKIGNHKKTRLFRFIF